MLNKFCFHLYPEKSLFIGENCNAFFDLSLITRSCDFRVHRAGFQLKNVWTSDTSWEPGMYECLNVLNNFCFHVYAQNLLSHFLTLTLSHTHSFSLSHSFNLSFNHSRHAEQVLFSSLWLKVAVYRRKLQWFFFYLSLLSSAPAPSPVSLDVIELVPS